MVLGATAVALVMFGAAPAFAQATACPPAPPAPVLPDGATAKPADMQKGAKAYDAWRTGANAVVECENAALKALQTQPNVAKYSEAAKALKEVQDTPEVKDYFTKFEAYKVKTDPILKVSETWQKSVEAFNAKATPPKGK
jgi:hypothetical protein